MDTKTPKGPSPDSPLGRLLAAPMRPGELIWIGLRPIRRAELVNQTSAQLVAGTGIDGDHYETWRNGARQVTLLASEDIAARLPDFDANFQAVMSPYVRSDRGP